MTKFTLLITYFLCESLFYSLANNDCVNINDCPAAIKLIEERKNDPKITQLMQSADCRLDGTQAKINCRMVTEESECIPLSNCQAALDLIEKRRNDQSTILLLRTSHCGEIDRKAKVYCNKIIEEYRRENKSLPNPRSGECGIQPAISKIFGGKPALIDEFPWTALLKYTKKNFEHFACHGSLINKRYVVTAAHCVDPKIATPKNVGTLNKVVLGEYDTQNETDCLYSSSGNKKCAPPPKEYLIESYKIHPGFDGSGPDDIALIRLKEDVEYSSFIKPICLPLESDRLKEGDDLWITGWGKTENHTMSRIKLKASVPYVEKENCESTLKSNFGKGQICAGKGQGVDSCKGDSGGPLMLHKPVGYRYLAFLMGVVSRGPLCGTGPAIYMEVTNYLPWILDNV